MIGEADYRSHETMPGIADELSRQHGIRVTVCTSDPIEDKQPVYHFAGLEALDDADLLVVYTRFRVLAESQMETIRAYLDSGRPVAGLRTSTHSFRFPKDSPYESWNAGFGTDLFGTPWRNHYGAGSRTKVTTAPGAAAHPILDGVESSFDVRSWLYQVLPLPETCKPLLMGEVVDFVDDGGGPPVPNPVAWTNTHNEGRVFYTSMGHPEDFTAPSFRKLLLNGMLWAMGNET